MKSKKGKFKVEFIVSVQTIQESPAKLVESLFKNYNYDSEATQVTVSKF